MKFKDLKDDKTGDIKYGDLSGQTYIGKIDIYNQNVTSLDGCPEIIYGDFTADTNNLTTLKGAPKKILKKHKSEFSTLSFSCSNNPKLDSLEYAPKLIEGLFFCRKTSIKNPLEQILNYQIKAERYYFDGGDSDGVEFNRIKDEFDKYSINKNVKSKGFRTLLGLDK